MGSTNPEVSQWLLFHVYLHPSSFMHFSADDLGFCLGFPLIFRLFSWAGLSASEVSITTMATPFFVMISMLRSIRRNGRLSCLLKYSPTGKPTNVKGGLEREAVSGGRPLPSAHRAPQAWVGIPSCPAPVTPTICLLPSANWACLSSEGKVSQDRRQLAEKQPSAFDKGAL